MAWERRGLERGSTSEKQRIFRRARRVREAGTHNLGVGSGAGLCKPLVEGLLRTALCQRRLMHGDATDLWRRASSPRMRLERIWVISAVTSAAMMDACKTESSSRAALRQLRVRAALCYHHGSSSLTSLPSLLDTRIQGAPSTAARTACGERSGALVSALFSVR